MRARAERSYSALKHASALLEPGMATHEGATRARARTGGFGWHFGRGC